MMRVLEFLTAVLIVAVIGIVALLVMPSRGHIERSLVVGKDMRQVYDVLNNFRRFPEYSVLRSLDSRTEFGFAGKDFGPGAVLTWNSTDDKVGKGALTIASATPEFDKVDSTARTATIVWNLDNNWRGLDKHFTLDLAREGSRGQLTRITWSYDVGYGWNLVNRLSNLYIHGDPDSFVQFGLNNLQNVLAGMPNINYSSLVPYIVQSQPTPVLFISGETKREMGIGGLDMDVQADIAKLQAAAKALGVNVTGPRIMFTTNYGEETYSYDVALPIDSSTLTIDKQSVELTPPSAPSLDTAAVEAPAAASSSAAPAPAVVPGSRDDRGRVIIDNEVRAMLAFGGSTLRGVWTGTFAGVPQTRQQLMAYARTHGYVYDSVVNRTYNVLTQPAVVDEKGNVTQYARYEVFLPITDAPAQTPEQAAGIKPPEPEYDTPASSSSTPAPASTAAAPAEAASVE